MSLIAVKLAGQDHVDNAEEISSTENGEYRKPNPLQGIDIFVGYWHFITLNLYFGKIVLLPRFLRSRTPSRASKAGELQNQKYVRKESHLLSRVLGRDKCL